MPLKRANEQTPCGALFDILKRFGGISHKELASMILSERPLADGRSPQSRSSDRSWVSRFVVHAPADASQERLFRDYGVAAQPAHQPFGLSHLRGDSRHGVRRGRRTHGACVGGEP